MGCLRRYVLLYVILLASSVISYAQNTNDVDSVRLQKILNLPDSYAKADSLINLAEQIRDFDAANRILDKALAISWELAYPEGLGKIYNRKGVIERLRSNFIKSIKYHKRALNFLEKSKDTLLLIKNYNNLANSLRKINMEQESLKYFHKALQLAQKINHKKSIAISYHGIGNIYSDIEDYKTAIPYFYKALKIEKELHNQRGIEYCYANLAEAYTMIGRKDSAEYFLKKTFELSKPVFGNHLPIEYNLSGKFHYQFGNYQQAVEDYKKSLEYLKNSSVKRYIANGMIMLGKTYFKLHRYNEAEKYINQGLKIAKEIGSKENIVLGLNALIDIALSRNDYKEAFRIKNEMETYEDSIINLRTRQNMDILNVIYETGSKDNEIKKLALEREKARKKSKTNFRILVLVSVLSLIIIILLLTTLYLKGKAGDILIESKNKEIKQYLEQLQLLKLKEKDNKEKQKDSNWEELTNEFCTHFIDEYDLTSREFEVLKLICAGMTNEEIAKKLYISKNTVKNHIRNIYEKLDVTNRMEIFKKLYHINLS
jgi:ATP/maltotriose-dependent transcriptional regulator MalT